MGYWPKYPQGDSFHTVADWERAEWQRDHQAKFDAMKAAWTEVEGDQLRWLVRKCQSNAWLRVGGVEFEDDPAMESDYQYTLVRFSDRNMLKAFFEHGNWSIRQGVQYEDLIFVNQVNGGDEWWSIKITPTELISFDSISMGLVIKGGGFDGLMQALLVATPEQCRRLDY